MHKLINGRISEGNLNKDNKSKQMMKKLTNTTSNIWREEKPIKNIEAEGQMNELSNRSLDEETN